jgi:hypothetical protein
VPLVAAGVYTIWRGAEFVYAGMSGRGATAESIAALDPERPWGLWTRLHTHALGRRSGDQFAVYMCDRFVLPTLTQKEFRLIGEGRLSLDLKTRELVRESLAFRFIITRDGAQADALERRARRGALSAGPPFLNPLGHQDASDTTTQGDRSPLTPSVLADELGVSPKTIRAWLRHVYPRDPAAAWTEWSLTEDQVDAARERFG